MIDHPCVLGKACWVRRAGGQHWCNVVAREDSEKGCPVSWPACLLLAGAYRQRPAGVLCAAL